MSEIDDGGPAFPRPMSELGPTANDHDAAMAQEGMSLRDHFAGQALLGMMADYEANATFVAEQAYIIADAMIAARKK